MRDTRPVRSNEKKEVSEDLETRMKSAYVPVDRVNRLSL